MSLSAELLVPYQQARKAMAAGVLRQAADLCKYIIDTDPECAYGYFLMSGLFKATGNLDKALMFGDMAIKCDQSLPVFYVHMAELLFYKKDFIAAENMARQALVSSPSDSNALGQLFAALREQKRDAEANQIMKRLLEVQPLDTKMAHLKAVLDGVTIENAPQQFVETYFDGYAPIFDEHLQKKLAYNVPQMVADLLRSIPLLDKKISLSLLDLGCGTGLVAQALQDMTALRVGVDLSQHMLNYAQSKQLYNELYKCDIVEFVAAERRKFDVVVAADVLIYIANIAPLFSGVSSVLSEDGIFAFSIEKEGGTAPSLLNVAGRYTQNVSHITSIAQQYGLDVLVSQPCIIRTEKNYPVNGMIFVLKKA